MNTNELMIEILVKQLESAKKAASDLNDMTDKGSCNIAFMPIDRLKMDKSIYDALKYGGLFVSSLITYVLNWLYDA